MDDRETAGEETTEREAVAASAEEAPGTRAPDPSSTFPVVGLGASAGGLEALERFLQHVPAPSGMGFVVVSHLDPARKGALVELLQRASKMPVVEIADGQTLAPDIVYVIPPNKDLSLFQGVLHLLPARTPRGLHLPIDFFFRSLAEDQQERSIGVVLSGMGSDGTLGLRAIKEKGGACFVQALASARFDGMPRSAIDAGLADVVAPVEELPARIAAYRKRAISPAKAMAVPAEPAGWLDKIFALLRAQSGNDFSRYKKSTVERRIERRMGLHELDKLSSYVRYLRENPREIDLLFKELLIGVTCFFRDPAAWEHLQRAVLPGLVAACVRQRLIRAWVPGCSTGEEAYSLAIALREALDQVESGEQVSVQIFATDLDKDAIERARLGVFLPNIAADVSPERLHRFFVQEERGYRVRKEVRETIVFAPQNIILDPPFTKLDLLCCRNLLIYLAPDLQKKLIPLFHYSLNAQGVLFLGSAETIGSFTGLFTPLDAKTRIYQRLEAGIAAPSLELPASLRWPELPASGERRPADELENPQPAPNLQRLVDRLIVQRFAPAAILTNDRGDILYISGRTGKYLEPSVGKANLNIFAMAREGLRYELSSAFAAALRGEDPVTVRGVKVRTNGEEQAVDLTIQRLRDPAELRGTVVIVISDMAPVPRAPALAGRARRLRVDQRIAELEGALQHAREELQTTREEMQTSQEELKSSNEELQSTNEELQSTNEELTTSKEEMQSMNEELQTVNSELQAKVDELSRINNDMKNLLNSTDIATLFLDAELHVRRFTTQTATLIKLIASDAGRPITDIATELNYPALADDARDVLRTLVFAERDVGARDGRWFKVRIMPYRTLENVIDGVVITFTDVTAARRLETALREQASQLRQLVESLPNLVWACQPDGVCDSLSPQWIDYTGIPEAQQLGYAWMEQVHEQERASVRAQWRRAIEEQAELDCELRLRRKDGVFRWFKARGVPIRDAEGAVVRWYGTLTDIDELKLAAEQRRDVEGRP